MHWPRLQILRLSWRGWPSVSGWQTDSLATFGNEERAEPVVRANALVGAAIFDNPSALARTALFEENGSPASARGSPVTFGEENFMRLLPLVFSLSFVVGITGCVSSGTKFYAITQPLPTAEKALVYVYFVGDGTWRGRPSYSVDGHPIAAVGQWEYSWCFLSPGEHRLRAEWSFMEKPRLEGGQFDPKELSLKIEPKTVYYVSYVVREDGEPTTLLEKSGGLIGKALSRSHVTSVELISQDEASTMRFIKGFEFRPSEPTK